MAFSGQQKLDIISKFRRHERDTSSPEVQIAILTARLDYLNEHFKTNTKDHHSRRGLMKIVGQRRRLLDYLQRKNESAYKNLINELNIRK